MSGLEVPVGGWAELGPTEVGEEHFMHKVLTIPCGRCVLLHVSSGMACKPSSVSPRFAPQTCVILGVA